MSQAVLSSGSPAVARISRDALILRIGVAAAGRLAAFDHRAAALVAVVEELPGRQRQFRRARELHRLFLDADPVRVDLSTASGSRWFRP